ncbi:MAG: hypothetical protein WCC01_04805 [Acidimicrobiia bacterium]
MAIAISGPGALSVDSASGIDKVLDGWVGLALVAGGVAVAVAQMATFSRPRINAEAWVLRRARSIPDVYFRFVP